jgi:hypothetical protein
MKSLRLLKKRLQEDEIQFTDHIENAMYLLPDGTMIDGCFYDGLRSEDHRAIFCGVNYGDYYISSNTNETHWKRLHKEYKVVRLVPETKIALIKNRQRLTDIQKEILNNSFYKNKLY